MDAYPSFRGAYLNFIGTGGMLQLIAAG
jgi:hypothetical protein